MAGEHAPHGLAEQRRSVQRDEPIGAGERGGQGEPDAVGHRDARDRFRGQEGRDTCRQRGVSDGGVHRGRTAVAAGRRSADQRASGGAQIIQYDRRPAAHLAGKRASRDDAFGAAFLDERQPDLLVGPRGQQLAEDLRALDAAHIGRDYGECRSSTEAAQKVLREHWQRGQMHRGDAKCIVECGGIVDIEADEATGTRRLEQLGNVARGDRITNLGAPVLAREREVGQEHHAGVGAGVAQALQQEQQAHKPLRRRRLLGGREGLHDEQPPSARGLERPQFEFPAIECPLFDGQQRYAGFAGDRACQLMALAESDNGWWYGVRVHAC